MDLVRLKIPSLPDSNEIIDLNGTVPIHDALGTVLGGVNSNGALAFQNTYDPFGGFTISGTPPSGYGQVYGMAGIEYDPTGLYHAGPRYYSPILQRFLSEDPIRGKANMYGYAGNNPITESDPSGLCAPGYSGGEEGGCLNISGGQENVPDPSGGLGALLAGIFQAIFGGGGGNPAPNFQRLQNAVAFGRFNQSVGLPSNGRNCQPKPATAGQYIAASAQVEVLTFEFFSGFGAGNQTFGPETATSQVFAQSGTVRDVLNNYRGTGKTSDLYTFGLPGVAAAGANPVGQFVGSFRYTITPMNGGILLSITNTTSLKSLTYDRGPQFQRGIRFFQPLWETFIKFSTSSFRANRRDAANRC